MRSRAVLTLIAAAVVIGSSVPTAAVSAAPLTWTRITSPSSTFTATKSTFVVSGVTSADVTSVDIDCVFTDALTGEQAVAALATSVPVDSGAFSAVADTEQVGSVCRLHAVPSPSTSSVRYFAPYAGPVLDVRLLHRLSGTHGPFWVAEDSRGNGLAAVADLGVCPDAAAATVTGSSLSVLELPDCAFDLLAENKGSDSATGSSITVDGHNAYLPSGTATLLDSDQGLGLTPAPLTTKAVTAHNGDLTVSESAVLQRCSVDDTYPPTNTSCPKLVSSGVTLTRTFGLIRGSHQVSVRDAFTSTGAAHRVGLQYQNGFSASDGPPGQGLILPGHGNTFVAPTAGQTVTGLGSKAATVLARSDRHATTDDPQADTQAFTWSKGPSKIRFENTDATLYALYYSLSVPAHGSARLGFALSEQPTTAGVKPLAAAAVADMVTAPGISTPHNGASIKGRKTAVTGSVSAGANGLPTSVTVNGHRAELTATSATRATWKVSFSEGLGTHTVKAVATDAAGNTATRSIKVRNVKP